MVLVSLALVPSLALLGLWGLSTVQLGLDWQRLAKLDDLNDGSGALARNVTLQLQEERRVTSQAMANDDLSSPVMLAQRRRTNEAINAFRSSTDGTPSSLLPKQLRDALAQDRETLAQIEGIRTAIDEDTITAPEIAFQSFTGVITSNLALFEALGNADNGDVAAAYKPLTDLMWADEMLSREDAALTYSWAADEIIDSDQSNFSQWIGTQHFLLETAVTPRVSDAERVRLQDIKSDPAWSGKAMVEAILSRHHPVDPHTLAFDSAEWRQVMKSLKPKFTSLIEDRSVVVDDTTNTAVNDLEIRMRTYAVVALGAVAVVITLSVLLTGSLRRRVFALRDEATRLETELPTVMARLRRGEDVDVAKEVREVEHGHDEIGQLGKALNLARRSAVETAVREIEQHRGFQRMLQRIARRTQLLIGLQLKKLDEMERQQEDPKILEGLFDLDHLTSRLRRYEENLVVLGGGQPQRRWRKPVRVIDVMRAALGEVQDYRRIRIDVTDQPWLYGRAVGALVHILAELMENAAAFSRPPNPVEARAALVGRGLAVEIEDRGLGMDSEEYERVNHMMAEPPEPDMVSRAEDARLGLYVVARLAAGLGLGVEFRPSVFGGTRVVVMVPAELVAEPPEDAADTPVPPPSTGAAAGPGERSGVRSGSWGRAEVGGREAWDAGQAPTPAVPRWAMTAEAAKPGYGKAPEYGGASDEVAAADAEGRRAAHGTTGASAAYQSQETARTDHGWPRPPTAHDVPEHSRAEAAEPRPAASAPSPGAVPGASLADGRTGPPPTLPGRSRGRALEALTGGGSSSRSPRAATGDPAPDERIPDSGHLPSDGPTPDHPTPDGLNPLPKRVRQANLAPGLKEPPKRARRPDDDTAQEPPPRDGARTARSGAAIGAFQRQSRLTRGSTRPADQAPGGPIPSGNATPETRSNHTKDAP